MEVLAEPTANRLVAAQPAAPGQGDLQQFTGSEDAFVDHRPDQHFRPAAAAAGVATDTGAFHPEFSHMFFLPFSVCVSGALCVRTPRED